MTIVLGCDVSGKTVVVWGAGSAGRTFMNKYASAVHFLVDSNPDKVGQKVEGVTVRSIDLLKHANPMKTVIFVASMFWPEISEEAQKFGFFRGENLVLATQLSHLGTATHRRYVNRNDLSTFFARLNQFVTDNNSRYVVLRDFSEVRSASPKIGDVDVLLDANLISAVKRYSSATQVSPEWVPIDLQLHEAFPAARRPYWYRPLAEDLLAGAIVDASLRVLPSTLESYALAYHMLFHKGPEAYPISANGEASETRMSRLFELLAIFGADSKWPENATSHLKAANYFPPLDMRRALVGEVEAAGGRMPWLRSICSNPEPKSDAFVVFIRTASRGVLRVVHEYLRFSAFEAGRQFRCGAQACNRIRSGVWNEADSAGPAHIALEFYGSLHKTALFQSDQEFQTHEAFSVKYWLRQHLAKSGFSPNVVHMPDSPAETLEALNVLTLYGEG